MSKLFLTIFNCFLLYVGWYGALILAANNYPLLAPSILVPILLWLVGISSEPFKRGLFALVFMILGFFVETTWISLGIVSYASPLSLVAGGAPLWVIGLWGVVGATLDDLLEWVKGSHPAKLAIIGAIGAPIVFFLATLVGAVSAPKGIILPLIVIAALWAILLPTFAKLRKLL